VKISILYLAQQLYVALAGSSPLDFMYELSIVELRLRGCL
jgi:hypothetical protein